MLMPMVETREAAATAHLNMRPAQPEDLKFILDCIRSAESAGTGRVSYAEIFGLTAPELDNLLQQLADDDTGQHEHSLNAFYILECDGKPVAGASAWIEGQEGLPSGTLKSQVISFALGFDRWRQATEQLKQVASINIAREAGALQLDGFYTLPEERGKGHVQTLIQQIIQLKQRQYPELRKAQILLVNENPAALRAYRKAGFEVARETRTDEPAVARMLNGTGRVLMEKVL